MSQNTLPSSSSSNSNEPSAQSPFLNENRSPSIRRRRNESPIWAHFKKIDQHLVCQIENCSSKYKTSSGNSSLAYHLSSNHGIQTVVKQ